MRDVAEQGQPNKRVLVEGHLGALVEAAPDAFVVVDTRGRIVLVNAQAERLFGYERSEMVGEMLEMLVPAAGRERHAAHRAGYLHELRVRPMGSGLELFGARKGGSQFPVEISLSPLETDEGTLVSAAIRDVTGRKETENALRLAYKELEAFSYSVAHDLRAPLRGMNGFAEILLEEYRDKLDADGLDALHEIRNNAVRMGALIDALLWLSRVARADLAASRVDLGAIARTVTERLSASAPGRAVDVVVHGDLWAWVDPPLARNLLENLIGNAWKFTGATTDARIEIGSALVDGHLAYFVRDNGAGFDATYANRLFSPFQRLHSEAAYPGTGIGLATSQRIVHRHGGRIWAEGSVGHGATFWFTLQGEPPGGTP